MGDNTIPEEENVWGYSLKEKKVAMAIMEMVAGYYIDLDPETAGAIRDRENTLWGWWMTKNIVGKMLTIVDSVMEDKERREATKSLVRQMIQDERESIVNLIYDRYKDY